MLMKLFDKQHVTKKKTHIIILLHSITDPSQVQQVMFAEIEWLIILEVDAT